jgi:hypothetical protein
MQVEESMTIRLFLNGIWLVSLAFIACGLISPWMLRQFHGPPMNRADAWRRLDLQMAWYIFGLLLFWLQLFCWTRSRPSFMSRRSGLILVGVVLSGLAFLGLAWGSLSEELFN